MKNQEKLNNAVNISNTKFAIISAGLVFGMMGQQVGLPIFLGSFGEITGPYFVVFFCSFLFNCFFWSICFYRMRKGIITEEMRNYKNHYKLILIGIFDALNGILIVFSSPLSRTPGALQAILVQSVIPFTILISKFILKKNYSIDQLVGGAMAFLGCLVSLIPKLNEPNIESVDIIWPIIYLCGNIPLVLMNIFEESIFEDIHDYDNYYMLAWESLYQITTVALLFWVDLIPGFGFSDSFGKFTENFGQGLKCFWYPPTNEKCNFCMISGLVFTFAYCFSYVFGAYMMKIASANSNAIISAMSPAFVIFFWLIFTDLNKWAGGKDYTRLEIICYIVSVLIISIGVISFRKAEKKQFENQFEKLNSGGKFDLNATS